MPDEWRFEGGEPGMDIPCLTAAEASALESVNAKIASRISGIESTTMHSYKEIDLLWGVAVGSKRDSRPEPSAQRQISSARDELNATGKHRQTRIAISGTQKCRRLLCQCLQFSPATMSRPQDDRNQEATVYLVSLIVIFATLAPLTRYREI
jgi:hypothetical protein